jgi:hypothetical protein
VVPALRSSHELALQLDDVPAVDDRLEAKVRNLTAVVAIVSHGADSAHSTSPTSPRTVGFDWDRLAVTV